MALSHTNFHQCTSYALALKRSQADLHVNRPDFEGTHLTQSFSPNRIREVLSWMTLIISDLKLFSFTYPILQVIGGCFRYDRRWWKCGRSSDPTNFLQRIQIFKTNRDNSNGHHDDMLHPPIMLNILPTMGWDVLWPIN
jgi:hypothetical protein